MTGPESVRHDLLRYLTERFGTPIPCRGRYFYSCGVKFCGGMVLLFDGDHPSPQHFCVDCPGGFLAGLSPDEAFELLQDLDGFAMKCTRLDLRADRRGEDIPLIQQMIDGCARGELAGARTWEPRTPYTGGQLSGFGITIGKRGKAGSGRYVRVYDKGLETETEAIGRWVRFEAEFSGTCAMKAGRTLAESMDWRSTLLSLTYGCIDFREANGSASIDRRERSEWWSAILEGIEPERVMEDRTKPSIDSTAKWLRTQVAPTIAALAEATGQPDWLVWRDLVGDRVSPSDDAMMRPVVWQYVRRCRETGGVVGPPDFVGDGVAPF